LNECEIQFRLLFSARHKLGTTELFNQRVLACIQNSFVKSKELPWESWYGQPSPDTLRNIKIHRHTLTETELKRLKLLQKDPADSASWLVEEDPDTTHPGRWKTTLYVFENTDTNHCVQIELTNHVSAGVKHEWLNDKILFVEVWWGHIGFTDLILNTETLRVLYMEDGFATSSADESDVQK
jgi:hypothetical protein